jgi:hypothetical protein
VTTRVCNVGTSNSITIPSTDWSFWVVPNTTP